MAIILIRTLIVFTSVTISMRIMGKRQLGELELSELIVAVLISDLAAQPLQDVGIPLLNGLIPILTLFACELILSGLIMRSSAARVLLCGKPSFMIVDGVIQQEEMRKNRFTLEELSEELRGNNILDLSKVKYAILETDGNLNAILYPEEQTVTAGQMGAGTVDLHFPVTVISNGELIKKNLPVIGRDISWIKREINARGAEEISDVYFMSTTGDGKIYFALKEN